MLPKDLADAVRAISRRDSWRAHELPAQVTHSILKQLFGRDLIEFRENEREDLPHKRFDPARPVYRRRVHWITKAAADKSGCDDWLGQELELAKDEPGRSPDIRLTVRGREALDAEQGPGNGQGGAGTTPLLTEGETDVWEALAGRAMTAKELRQKLDLPSEQAVKEHVKSIRAKGRILKNQPGRGYFRPDAPPAEA